VRPALRTGVPERFWSAARASPRWLLALDFDGTLAPFDVDPARARPAPAARRALARIVESGRTAVAVLSGRPACDVAALLDRLPVPIVGEHGWEVRFPDGARLRHPFAADLVDRLDSAAAAAAELAPARVERKRTAVVVHVRGLPLPAARRARAAARRLFTAYAADPRLAARPVAGGFELRVTGRDKGLALAELAAALGPGPFVVAVGDDDTDEDAFRSAQRLGGWGIRVGRPRPTVARARLASPAGVARFLEEWWTRIDGGGARRGAEASRR